MQNRIVLGMASLCLGVLVFSLQDPLIKAVSGTYPVTEVMAIRSIVALPILLVLVHADVGLRAIFSKRFRMLTTRALILFTSYTLYYLAIAALPLADAVALYFMAPLFIMALAGPYLGERVAGQTLITVMVGMLGVLVMLRPGAGLFDWAALLSLASAVLYGFSQLMARKIGDTESSTVMAFYQNGVYLLGAAAVAGLFWLAGMAHATHPSLEFLVRPWIWPTSIDCLTMAACGVVASAGMILVVAGLPDGAGQRRRHLRIHRHHLVAAVGLPVLCRSAAIDHRHRRRPHHRRRSVRAQRQPAQRAGDRSDLRSGLTALDLKRNRRAPVRRARGFRPA